MHELKSKDRKYYEELSQNMNINKEEAEIDVKYLEKLFPIITGINSALKIYSNYHS
jgi:hypothetical protein